MTGPGCPAWCPSTSEHRDQDGATQHKVIIGKITVAPEWDGGPVGTLTVAVERYELPHLVDEALTYVVVEGSDGGQVELPPAEARAFAADVIAAADLAELRSRAITRRAVSA